MPCTFSQDLIEQTIAFHGHSCPGLAIGIRAAELAITRLGNPHDITLVAVSETDMCGVDAIQYLTGCTYGKGNFIHRDVGKMAFSFFDRERETGFRALLNPDVKEDAEQQQTEDSRSFMVTRFMEIELDNMFIIKEPAFALPRSARVLSSLKCVACNEWVMESRTRRFDGQTLCMPCFAQVEQKL